MKKLLLFISLGILSSAQGFSQFGMDVIIHSDTALNQRNVVLATAFNGWLYSAFTTVDSASNKGGITIRKSIDKGITWQQVESYLVNDVRYVDVEIEVAGTDTNDLKLFVLGLRHNLTGPSYRAFVDVYNATTLTIVNPGALFYDAGTSRIYDLDMSTDYEHPAVGATPYSVGVILSRFGSVYDSVIYFCSTNGGASFGIKQNVATTSNYFGKVSLSYGRSVSGSNGRYFAAWEQKSSSLARNGHIYTSRSQSTVDGSWISPVCLDSVSSTMINLCRNPRIATSYNNVDNDSGSVSAVVLVDRDYAGNASDYDLLGFYNKRAHFTSFWNRLDVVNSGENDMQADITFDPVGNNFHATYFDSTNFKLAYVKNDMNLTTPSTWIIDTVQYNDVAPGTNPFPRISFNQAESAIGAVWTRAGIGTKGVAMFDADYTVVFAGINENDEFSFDISTYPNPTSNFINIDLQGIDQVNVQLLNYNGEVLMINNNLMDNTMIDLSSFAAGVYLLRMEYKGQIITKKIIKN